MGWLRSVGSIKLKVSFAEYRLFYRSLLQKRPIILSILLTKATPYAPPMVCHVNSRVCLCEREAERENVCVRETETERENVCVRERETERENVCVCVCERERQAHAAPMLCCVSCFWQFKCVCVRARERERTKERTRECPCVCV